VVFINELAEGARQAIDLPDNNNIALPRIIRELHQFRSLGLGPRSPLLIDARALHAVERIHLQMGFLSIGRNAGVADFHGAKTTKKQDLPTMCLH
jgi:hypothetical protein